MTDNEGWIKGLKIPALLIISPSKSFVFEIQLPSVHTLWAYFRFK